MPTIDINAPLNQYKKNLQSARDLEVIYLALCRMTANSVPKDELLRAELVALVSALDTYIHDLVRMLLKLYYSLGNPLSNTYLNKLLLDNPSIVSIESLDQVIRENHGYLTFQAPKKIEAILNKVAVNNIWGEFIHSLPNIEQQLSLIVKRRNQIAHESDINPTTGLGEKWLIDIQTIEYTKNILDTIVNTIDITVRKIII